MPKNILEAIKKRRLKAAKSSIAFGEARDKVVSQQAQVAKATLASIHGNEVPKDVEPLQMASIYYRMVDQYFVKASIRMPTQMSKKGLSMWRRVVKSCHESGVEPEAYLRAQFQYFNSVFGKPPALHQLATKKAQDRAIACGSSSTVIGNDVRFKGDFAIIMRSSEQQMQDIMRAQKMTREEVYKNFVLTGLMLFPKAYLDADPAYQKVLNNNG